MHPQIAAAIRDYAAKSVGTPPEAVLVAATHNHAGPIGLRAGMFSRLDPELSETLVSRVSGAIDDAWSKRLPAQLKAGSTTVDAVGMNRRDPAWPIDPVLCVVLVDGDDGPIACLLNFACHATVLSGSNLLLSAEFPGVACRIVEQATGAGAVYLNGACGNVNPVWIRQDFASVERAGQAIGGAAVHLIAELRAAGQGLRAHNIRWDEFPEAVVTGRLVEPRIAASSRMVELPRRPFEPDGNYAAAITTAESEARALEPGSAERRDAMARLARLQNERWAAVWARQEGDVQTQSTEVQAIRIGNGLTLLALPGEFFAETASAIRAAVEIEDLLVACYANDYIGYVVPDEAYDQGGYESGVTFFAPGTEAIITEAAVDILRAISNAPTGDGDA
jgi:hypothetical protein